MKRMDARTIGAAVAGAMAVVASVAMGAVGLVGPTLEKPTVSYAGTKCVGRQSDARYDWPWYDSLDELEEASDAVVVATITGCTKPEGKDAGSDTWINAKVLGGIPGGGVERANRMAPPPTGEILLFDGYTSASSGAGGLDVGRTYVFFLGANGTADDGNGVTYHELTPALSVFPVTAETKRNPYSSRNTEGSFSLTGSMAVRLGIIGKDKLSSPEPVSDDDIKRMHAVEKAVGLDDDAETDDGDDVTEISKSAWWTEPYKHDDGTVEPDDTMIVELSPGQTGTYRITAYCSGTGGYDAQVTINETETRHENVTCSPDEVARTSFTMTVTDAKENSHIQFRPSAKTTAAGGFRFEKVG